MSLLLAADACLSWFCYLSQSNKSVLTGILSSCMQHWLKNHWPDQALFKHSLHTNCISNSAILHNNYISLLSDCARVHVKKKWHHKGSHSSKVSGSNCLVRLQTWKKWWAGALLSEKFCLFGQKPSWKSHANLNYPVWKRKRKRRFWLSGDFWFDTLWCFLAPLGVLFISKMDGRLL